MLVPTPAVRNLIREGKTHQIPSAMQTGSSVGMQTMDAALATLVRAGKITQRLAESALLDARGAAPPARRGRLRHGRLPRPRRDETTHGHLRLQGDGPHRREGRAASVEAESKQVVTDQLKSRGLIVLDITDKHASKEINLEILQQGQGRPT